MATDTITQELLDKAPPEIRELAEALRKLVREVAPEAPERGVKGWRLIAFERNGIVCGIQPQKSWVNLIFMRGVELPDPQGVLEGEGKATRAVKVKQLQDITDAVKALVQDAFKLGGEKAK
ncbi:MAG: DUF1801 domain-containing protein [Chloroflexi bacterium]|nr:DUF1801 domain-containing protein [Chloroflexota bacterium]